jgi:hypothetical protein
VWVCFAKVTDVAFDAESGMLAAVDIVGGPLAGETDVPCSVCPSFGWAGMIQSAPLKVGAVVVVTIPEGDLNVDPQIVAVAIGPETKPATTVAGQSVANVFGSSFLLGAPDHEANIELKAVRLVAPVIKLVEAEPTQAFVRGNDFTTALKTFLDSTDTMANTVQIASTAASSACIGPLAPLKAFFDALTPSLATWRSAISTFKATLVEGQALSTKIKGE